MTAAHPMRRGFSCREMPGRADGQERQPARIRIEFHVPSSFNVGC
jgi:hypothetical protein